MKRKPTQKYNKLCLQCEHRCKQSAMVTVVDCPRFERKPVQMLIPLKFHSQRQRKDQQN